MQNIILGIFLLTLIWPSCAPDHPGEFHSLSQQQPMVLATEPTADAVLANPVRLTLHFSERLDIQSISPLSVALIHHGWREDFIKDSKLLVDSLEEQALETIPLNYELGGEEKTLQLTPQAPLEEGRYYLAVTPRLSSTKGIPFNQRPGSSPQVFFASYQLGTSEDASEGAPQINFGPAPQFLRINEILYDGKNSETDGEAFIELFGTPGADISAYEIALINGADGSTTEKIILPAGSLLDSDGLFVLADLRTNSTDTTQVPNAHFLDQFDPQNGPDGVQLLDREGKLLDALCYGEGVVATTPEGLPLCEGDPAPDVAAGHSLSRQMGLDTQDNHMDFLEKESPSPGQL